MFKTYLNEYYLKSWLTDMDSVSNDVTHRKTKKQYTEALEILRKYSINYESYLVINEVHKNFKLAHDIIKYNGGYKITLYQKADVVDIAINDYNFKYVTIHISPSNTHFGWNKKIKHITFLKLIVSSLPYYTRVAIFNELLNHP